MTGTLWLCSPECWQTGHHTTACFPLPDPRDERIAELEAERDRLKDEIAVRSVIEEGLRRDLAEAEKQVKKLKSRMRPIV